MLLLVISKVTKVHEFICTRGDVFSQWAVVCVSSSIAGVRLPKEDGSAGRQVQLFLGITSTQFFFLGWGGGKERGDLCVVFCAVFHLCILCLGTSVVIRWIRCRVSGVLLSFQRVHIFYFFVFQFVCCSSFGVAFYYYFFFLPCVFQLCDGLVCLCVCLFFVCLFFLTTTSSATRQGAHLRRLLAG